MSTGTEKQVCQTRSTFPRLVLLCELLFAALLPVAARGDEPEKPAWRFTPERLRPFWLGDTVEGESVLFIRDEKTGEATASVLFPIQKVVAVHNSEGTVTYEEGRDYTWQPDTRELVIPAGSRIPSRTPADLRRPAKSQPYELTHRDGNGEILFGARLEYHAMQTCITYTHAPGAWKGAVPTFDAQTLPRTIARLKAHQPLSIVVLGDSIAAGGNASLPGNGPPYQPAFPELVRLNLEAHWQGPVKLTNLAVGGMDTRWGLTQTDKVLEHEPDLVILAFGMNDSAGRPAAEYKENTRRTIAAIREQRPDCEVILVATMLGNPAWVRLKQDLFPQYRDALAELCEPGIALADLTAVWTGFLELKRDWDQTGNGVNHPNDFGHRVYAQVISALLIPPAED